MSGVDIRDLMEAAATVDHAVPAVGPGGRAPATIPEVEGPTGPTGSLSPVVLTGAVRLFEFVLVLGTGLLVHRWWLADAGALDAVYVADFFALSVMTVLVFQAVGAYTAPALRTFVTYGLRIVAGWSLVFLITLAAVFFAKMGDNLSRVWLAAWYVVGLTSLMLERLALSVAVTAMTRRGRFEELLLTCRSCEPVWQQRLRLPPAAKPGGNQHSYAALPNRSSSSV